MPTSAFLHRQKFTFFDTLYEQIGADARVDVPDDVDDIDEAEDVVEGNTWYVQAHNAMVGDVGTDVLVI